MTIADPAPAAPVGQDSALDLDSVEHPYWRGRPVWIEIDLDTVAANTRRIVEWVGPGTEVMAVVKADGYGLGAPQIAAAALAGGASWLGVACVDEGLQLRAAGLDCPILVLGPTTPSEMARAVVAQLTITVNSLPVVRALATAAQQCRVRAPVHLKLDSGLHRFGRAADDLTVLAAAVAAMPGLWIEGLYTHFANADDPLDDFAGEQLARLLAMRRRLADAGIPVPLIHAASSAALLEMPESHLDLVRVGILLGGHYPTPGARVPLAVQPAVIVRARIARIFRVAAGASVGYGRTYIAPTARTLALVPVGYADGYHRVLSGRSYMLVGGRRAPVVGRISMDQLTLDVTGISDLHEGDPVVVVGRQGAETVDFATLADLAGTISYELLTHLGKRLPRIYRRGGEVVELTTLLGTQDLPLADPLAGLPSVAGSAYIDLPPAPDEPRSTWLPPTPTSPAPTRKRGRPLRRVTGDE